MRILYVTTSFLIALSFLAQLSCFKILSLPLEFIRLFQEFTASPSRICTHFLILFGRNQHIIVLIFGPFAIASQMIDILMSTMNDISLGFIITDKLYLCATFDCTIRIMTETAICADFSNIVMLVIA